MKYNESLAYCFSHKTCTLTEEKLSSEVECTSGDPTATETTADVHEKDYGETHPK